MPRTATVTFEQGLVKPLSPYQKSPYPVTLTNTWLSPEDWGAVEPIIGFGAVGTSPPFTAAIRSVHAGQVGIAPSVTLKTYAFGAENANKILSELDVDASTWTTVKTVTGITGTLGLHSAQINDKLVFVANGVTPFQINLSDDVVSDVGVIRADITDGGGVTTALNSGGNDSVKGVVKYWVAELTTTTESALTTEFGEIDCGDGNRVDVAFPAHTTWNSKIFRIYRTLANGSQPFMVDQAFTTGTSGGTFTDDVPDSDLGNLPYLHGDPPPNTLISVINQFNRLWGLTSSGRLYWSDVVDHESWWTTSNGNWIDVYAGDGDTGTALAKAPDGLYVFKQHHLYHVHTQNLDSIRVTPLTLAGAEQKSIGTPVQRAVTISRGGTAFMHEANVYLLNGLEVRAIGDEVQESLLGSWNPLQVSIGYYEKYGHLLVSTEQPTDAILIYDFRRRKWIGQWARHATSFMESGEFLYAASVTQNTGNDGEFDVHKLYNGKTLNGVAMDSTFELSPFLGSDPSADKIFHWVELLIGPAQGFSKTVSLICEIDQDSANLITTSVDLLEAGSSRLNIRRRVNLGFRGRELAIKLTSTTSNPRWKLYAVTYSWDELGSNSALI